MVFPAVFNLADLNGQNGFIINGINGGQYPNGDFSGCSVSGAGDVNGDGISDIIIGADGANYNTGQSYVVYGNRNGFAPFLNLSSLNGQNGFVINGVNDDYAAQSGISVSDAGDINADGIADIIIGVREGGINSTGQSYVVFGSRLEFPSSISPNWFTGQNGFVINGIDDFHFAGISVSGAGDVNADGIDDVVIGALASQSYVLFGSKDIFSSQVFLADLNGVNGFVINGNDTGSLISVSGIGDINADSIDDIIIGAPWANYDAGQTYVIFGSKNEFPPQFNLSGLNGQNGFVINGINYIDDINGIGGSIGAAGDVNDDGIMDVIIGESNCMGGCGAGNVFIVFGNRNGFSPQLDLNNLNGQNGFIINGIHGRWTGSTVSSVGDINSDGIDDIIMGVPGANNEGAGQSYIIFGSKYEFPAVINSTWLNGQNGFIINGININDTSGWSVSGAGDINADGIADIIISAELANYDAGQTYVIFGQASSFEDNLDT